MRTHRHRHRRPRITPRDGHQSALGRLEAALQSPDEAAWYAERLEQVGRIMFGDLWESGERKAASAEAKCP